MIAPGTVRGLLVAGTTSDAGKSVVTAGICRWLARQGVRVAPFKAQNMSLNSVVTRDGAEIGRAQAMQAAAAGVEPEAAMNPVLLKPGGNGTTQVMVLGEPVAEIGAAGYRDLKPRLFGIVLACLADLAGRFDVVVCEGAGSPAEINLAGRDIANMALARAAALPAVVVADIDRGGVFAALYGTVALLHPRDQALVAGFVLNKFRGDAAVLEPGLGMLGRLTGRPVLGVLPWADGIWLDAEDSLSLGGAHARTPAPPGGDPLRVAVPVLGICGGYQMLGRQIHDDVESGAGLVPGLGLLPAVTRFGAGKVLRRCQDTVAGLPVTGYEIHHGVVHATGGDRFPGGCAAGAVSGTSWHGLLENDGFRRAYLHQAASTAGRRFLPGQMSFQARREQQLDILGDLITGHTDTAALLRLIEQGAPPGLPFIPPGAP